VIGIALGTGAMLAALLVPLDPPVSGLKLCLAGMGVALLGLTALLHASRRRAVPALLLIGAGFLTVGVGLRSCIPGPQLQSWFHTLPKETVFSFKGYSEPNLIFYSDRIWQHCHDPQKFLDGPGPRVLVITEYQMKLEDYVKREPAKDLRNELDAMNTKGYSMFRFEGFNPARSAFMTLRVYHRP